MNKETKDNVLIFAYNEMYYTYRKLLRKRKKDPIQVEFYKDKLKKLQSIIKDINKDVKFRSL